MNYEEVLKVTGLEKDLPLIDDYVTNYGSYGAMPMRKYLQNWYNGKNEYLLKLFSDNLIYRERIEYHEPMMEVQETIYYNFIMSDRWQNDIIPNVRLMLAEILFEGKDWEEATSWNRDEVKMEWRATHILEIRFFWEFYNLLTESWSFAHNMVGRNEIITPDSTNKLPKSFSLEDKAKPFRTILNFIKLCETPCRESNPSIFNDEFFTKLYENIEKSRILHSQLLNRKTLKGNLCISIHPLDYMTMSDNDYNWSSCMRWRKNPGEYRIGTLEMLTSPMVVVAYLDGDKEWHPTDTSDTWTNKKWRQLFIVHPNVISGIKDYPYREDELTKIVLNRLTQMVEDKLGWGPYEKKIEKADEEPIYFPAEKNNNSIFLRFITNYMYNDTECNYYLYRRAKEFKDTPDLFIGYADAERVTYELSYSGTPYCLNCGEKINLEDNEEDYTDTLICPNCSDWVRCDNCNERIYDLDSAIYINGIAYCVNCASYCEVCGKAYIPTIEDEQDKYINFIFKAKNRWGNYRDYTIGMCKDCFAEAEPYVKTINAECYEHVRQYGMIDVALPDIPSQFSDALNIDIERDENGRIVGLVDFNKEETISPVCSSTDYFSCSPDLPF